MRTKLTTSQLLELHRLEVRMYTAQQKYKAVKDTELEKKYKVRLTHLQRLEREYSLLIESFRKAA